MAEANPAAEGHQRGLVVMGASAGGVETLKEVVGRLPADLPAAICVVLHIAPSSPSALAHILERAGRLPCRAARDGEALEPGEMLVAPPDHHLLIEDNVARLSAGPRENGHRPAIDALFRSAANAWHDRVVGVVLSGTRDDGSAGLAAIKANGGCAIVRDPDEAMYREMPANAISHVAVDAVLPSRLIAQTVSAMVRGQQPPPGERRHETAHGHGDGGHGDGGKRISVRPECGGEITQEHRAAAKPWSGHVGQRYCPRGLAEAQAERLWTGLESVAGGAEAGGREATG
jgi:two-component system chemotaxis response regulator CheB